MNILKSIPGLAAAAAAILSASSAFAFDATLEVTAVDAAGARRGAVEYWEPGFMNGLYLTEGCVPEIMSCNYEETSYPTSTQRNALASVGISRTNGHAIAGCVVRADGSNLCLVDHASGSFLADYTQGSTGGVTIVEWDLIDTFTIDVDDSGTKYCCTVCGPLGCQGCSQSGLNTCKISLSCEVDGPWFCDP